VTIRSGTKLGRYEVRSKLGAGGMGEVYLAQDTKLERKVALKILPENVAADQNRMKRFVQEAKAASALNHPNIITIHEIDQTDSHHFIATEFIDGQTLRECMRRTPLKLGEVLDVAVQIATALAAAHAVGIVHRDIKPENVMLRNDGIVKVLDFGLAKLTERTSSDLVDSEAQTRAVVNTEPGVAMGTAIYMSPEQARGLPVDARTDIFSLGILTYEMVTGHLPFDGSNTYEIIASILSDKEAPPVARYAAKAPAELERIIAKTLRKNRDERYQTIRDLLLDLKSLMRRMQFEAEQQQSVSPSERTSAEFRVPPLKDSSGVENSITKGDTPSTLLGSIKRHKMAVVLTLASIVVALGSIAYFSYFARPAGPIDSIAVLPLVNASNDPNTEYLSDGITESIISNLSQLPQLRVMARSTVFRFKGQEIDPQKIGRDLDVGAVLTGRLLRQGDNLIIRTELVNVADGARLWGGEYNRQLSDVLAVQQDISREISENLRLRLTGDQQKRLTRRDTTNADAYQFYLRGRYFWNKRTAEGLNKAIEEFQRALDRDPNYALSYAGMADCYLALTTYGVGPSSESDPIAKAGAAANSALRIDDTLAEAHTSLAHVYRLQWRWADSEEQSRRAIGLNPNYPTAHQWFAWYFYERRQFDDALRESKRAHELDPLSSVISANLALAYLVKNDSNAALEAGRKAIELDPSLPRAHHVLAFAYLKQRRFEEAIAEFEKAVELSGRASIFLSDLGYAHAVTGKSAEALAILKELEARYARRESIGSGLAAVYAGLGDEDQAFAWLEKDFEQRSFGLPEITWWFAFENLRSDPRYADLVRRIGLQP
jgi:eukaryotic-like serine/threonine-protein kinase